MVSMSTKVEEVKHTRTTNSGLEGSDCHKRRSMEVLPFILPGVGDGTCCCVYCELFELVDIESDMKSRQGH